MRLADIAGVCTGFASLNLTSLSIGPLALGGGTVAHRLTVSSRCPVPAVLEIVRAAGAPSPVEAANTSCVPRPAPPCLPVSAVQTGSDAADGGDDDRDRSRAVATIAWTNRTSYGCYWVSRRTAAAMSHPGTTDAIVIAANIDDLDPRAWPVVLDDPCCRPVRTTRG